MGFLWGFYGFSILYRILEAHGRRFMNIWSYGVSMGFLLCILQLLCIASLHHGECAYIKIFKIHGFLFGFFTAFVYSLYSVQRSTTGAWFDENGKKPHGHPIRPLHSRLYFRDTC